MPWRLPRCKVGGAANVLRWKYKLKYPLPLLAAQRGYSSSKGYFELYFHRTTVAAAPPSKRRRLNGIVSGIFHHRKHSLHVRRRGLNIHR